MNIWLVTLGSSDVQIQDADVWPEWYQAIRRSIYNMERSRFTPTRSEEDEGVPYRIHARVLGITYEKLGVEVSDQCKFPLLDEFQRKLQAETITIDKIIILTSDQSNIFEEEDRDSYRCPYWQDTCLLYPLVSKYLQKIFPDSEISELQLIPESLDQGLADWDAVLQLVRRKILELEIEPQTVYVSHQAGTPAISSAVQFCSLAKFGDRVKFLVSNEYNPSFPEKPLEGSSYLRGIRIQEAKALLGEGSYNYAGAESLIKDYIGENEEVKMLFQAAKNWNVAKFSDFLDCLKCHPKFESEVAERTREENWWWIGYESAYLAIIRHQQDNIVDALFHSFRSVEGLICTWAETKFKDCIVYDKKGSPQITERIKDKNGLLKYWEKIKEKQEKWLTEQDQKNQQRIEQGQEPLPLSTGLFSQSLYLLLEMDRPESKKDKNMKTVLYSAKDERNQQFHRLLGLNEENLFQAWKANDVEKWKTILLGCLNFIAREDLKSDFETIEAASLMVRVHEELERAIANL